MAANQHSTDKATRSQVCLGTFEIEGYLLPEQLWTDSNKFAVSKTQAVLLAYPDYDRTQAAKLYSRIVKAGTSKSVFPDGFTLYPKIEVEGRAERVDLLPLNEVPMFLQLCRIVQKREKKLKATERGYSLKLATSLAGKIEVVTLAGKIDVLTPTELIEVKKISQWKYALGQVIAYGYFYPSHQKRIHLYGETQASFLEMIEKIAAASNVTVTWEP